MAWEPLGVAPLFYPSVAVSGRFAGPAVLRRAGATKFVSFDQDVDLPEG